jgi:hypothetical protein
VNFKNTKKKKIRNSKIKGKKRILKATKKKKLIQLFLGIYGVLIPGIPTDMKIHGCLI